MDGHVRSTALRSRCDMARPTTQSARFNFRTLILPLIPVLALAGVIALFLSTGGGLNLQSAAPVEGLDVERYILRYGGIHLYVRNTGPQDITISQVVINSAVWPFSVIPSATIPRLGRATIHLDYGWAYGEAYAIRIFTGNSIPFDVEIPVAFQTPQPSNKTFWSFTLIGLYVGIIPIFLGLDPLAEALEVASEIPTAFQGIGLIGIGAVSTFMLLDAISQRQTSTTGNERSEEHTS